MSPGEPIIVFSDLDGTLLDENYSFAAAQPALRKMAESAIPLILCSSKTRKEIEHYRDKMENFHPFISENGGGIFIPEGYFPDETVLERFSPSSEMGYRVIRLGTPYCELRKALAELRSEGFPITGFGDLSTAELAKQTGLSTREALLCKERDFDEPFLFKGSDEEKAKLFHAIRDRGLFTTQGVYLHLLGDNDKGKAVKILTVIFRARYGSLRTVALGDSPNDLPMLESADIPLAVQRPDGRHHPSLSLPNLDKVEGVGPHGWNSAMLALLARLGAVS
ncbi:MAG: HAD-IIB family hydrolase [Geobacter sp.]|nr:MAG: HAD-IIB family hydrolase [Geobacter sp.]